MGRNPSSRLENRGLSVGVAAGSVSHDPYCLPAGERICLGGTPGTCRKPRHRFRRRGSCGRSASREKP